MAFAFALDVLADDDGPVRLNGTLDEKPAKGAVGAGVVVGRKASGFVTEGELETEVGVVVGK